MTHPSGLFSWCDVALPDVAAGKTFYEQLFGWDGTDEHDPDGNLIYVTFRKDGDLVAGLGPLPPAMAEGGMPPMWSSYVSVDSVDAAVSRAVALGASVMLPPMDVMTSGRMAVIGDPQGAALSLWQAGDHLGADRFDDTGFMTWNELMTRDLEGAKAFYASLFGWTYQSSDSAGFEYVTVELGDRATGGMLAMGDEAPDWLPSHWMVYFRVADCDTACARLVDLGGAVSVPAFDSPAGRIAVVNDPQGGTFSVIGPAPTG